MKKIRLALIACACLAVAAAFYFVLKPSHSKPVGAYRVLILWTGLGELEWAKRLEKACGTLGWECEACYGEKKLSRWEKMVMDDSIIPSSIPKRIRSFEPDFVISLKENHVYSSRIPHYLAVTGCLGKYFDLQKDIRKSLRFDGILHACPDMEPLRQFFQASGKEFHGISWYPSCSRTEYFPVVPKKIFFCGFQWDDKRDGPEYRKMFSLLDQEGCLEVYGPIEKWSCAPHSAKGLLPFDGESINQAIRNAGVALVLHSSGHIQRGTPAGRIFEAAAASAVIICDRHPFVMKEFGDSVLYVDDEKGGEELFRQVYDHYRWILSHPEEAEEMARRAHAIFLEKFTLEMQMLQLAEMHRDLLKNRMPYSPSKDA